MDAETVVRTYSDMIYGIAFRYAGNAADAEDIYSETFLAYFKKERGFESEEHRKAWLIRVAVNAAKSFLMKRGNYAELNEEITGNEEKQIQQEEAIDLRAAIERLPAVQKEVICLFYINDLPVRQIAEITGKSETNVKVILTRARKQLKSFLEE